jgi:hypothetical protein
VSAFLEGAFELGKVLLETELSKHESKGLLLDQGGWVQERIVLQRIGKFWNQQNMWDRPDGLVVVTSHRLAFLAKVKAFTATTEFLSFPWTEMQNVRAARVMGVSPAIQFEVKGKPFIFTLLSSAEEVVAAVAAGRG